ncbi:MAG: hypothetical protein KF905_06225 [Flavobacteriales bacterium]|nr:hypothetical protein [Flavobacteriales bacterium]
MDDLLDVPKEKQAFQEELLRGFPLIKARKLSPVKAERIRDMVEAIVEMKAIEAGKAEATFHECAAQ